MRWTCINLFYVKKYWLYTNNKKRKELAPSLNVEAHETLYGPSRETTIWVKGARLRATGSTTGTVLGLMYVDEKIIVYTQMLGEDTEFNYIHRLKPDMWGYTDHHNYN